MFSGTYLTDDALLGAMELPLRKLVDAGFSLRDAVGGLSTICGYTIGFASEEQAVHPRPGERDERYDPSRRAQSIDAEEHPLALAAGEELFAAFDERFEHGLRLILYGMERPLHPGP